MSQHGQVSSYKVPEPPQLVSKIKKDLIFTMNQLFAITAQKVSLSQVLPAKLRDPISVKPEDVSSLAAFLLGQIQCARVPLISLKTVINEKTPRPRADRPTMMLQISDETAQRTERGQVFFFPRLMVDVSIASRSV